MADDHTPTITPGTVFAEYEIQHNGMAIDVVDRTRINARCCKCDHRWQPETEAALSTCPNEDDHSVTPPEKFDKLETQFFEEDLSTQEFVDSTVGLLVDEFDIQSVLAALVNTSIDKSTRADIDDLVAAHAAESDTMEVTAQDITDTVSADTIVTATEHLYQTANEHSYQVNTDEVYVEEYHFPSGRIESVRYQPVIQCEHCDYAWGTSSDADRPSCASCHCKTDRNTVGKHYEVYFKYALFSGDEDSLGEVTDRFRAYAERFDLMASNGWRFDCTTQSSHVALSKGDAPQQEIIA